MSIADDLKVLDEWSDEAPQEAARFTAGLQRKYPRLGPEDALLQFAIDRPDIYRNMVTELEARFTRTTEQAEREVKEKASTLERARRRLKAHGTQALSQAEREALAAAGDLEIRIVTERDQREQQQQREPSGIDLGNINSGL